MPSGYAPIPTSFTSITTSRPVATVPAKSCPDMIRGGRPARRSIFRTYDGLSKFKPVALHYSPPHARGGSHRSSCVHSGVGQGGSGLFTPSVVTTASRISAHVLKALGDDGSKIELDQSETTMRELSRTATAHRIVPV